MILQSENLKVLEVTFRISISDTTTVSYVSDEIDELLGFNANSIITGIVTLQSRIHADDQDIAKELFSNEIESKLSFFNIRLRHANGHIRCVKGQYSKSRNSIDNDIKLELLLQDSKSLWQKHGDQTIMVNFKAMMENTNDYIYFKDRNHVFTGASETLVALTNPTEHWSDLLGKTDYDVFPESFADIYYSLEKQVFAGVTIAHEEQETLDNEGNKGWVDNRKYPINDDKGNIVGLFGIARDITEQKKVVNELQLRESYQHALLDNFPFMVWLKDAKSCFLTVNRRFAEACHIDYPDKLIGKSDFEIFPNDLAENYQKDDLLVMNSLQHKNVEEEIVVDDTRKWFETYKAPVVNLDGSVLGTVGFAREITNRKHAENALRIAATVFESQEAMAVTDVSGLILRVNKTFTDVTGYSQSEVIGRNPRILQSGRHQTSFYKSMWECISKTGAWQGEIWNRRKSGEIYPEFLSISAVKDSMGIVTNYVATFSDITSSKAATEEIKSLAFYDPLTLLPNRRLLLDRFQQALTASSRNNHRGALLFLDLDHFKNLNDTLGHAIGDLLLQQVAERLSWCVREGDTVARLGGDEFVVILEGLSPQQLEAAAQAEAICNKIFTSLNQVYQLENHDYYNSPSIGVTLFSGHNLEIEELLKHADIAMYDAKKSGRNRLRFFDPLMQKAINSRAELEHDLHIALERKQFQLHYQLQVDNTGHPFGAEALIRWLHPERGLVFPSHFIPLAEETGLILSIGHWVLETACAQLKAWEKDSITQALTLSINVSAKQFNQIEFVKQVKDAVNHYAINPMLLKLELTESMLIDNVDHVITTMHSLNKIGVRFELDDFGTGYSSLQYLKQLPLYQLKIDQSFIRDIAIDRSDRTLLKTIITMAQNLDLKVIAEGVETEQQRQLILDNGCVNYQGYLFGKAMPIDELWTLLGNLIR